MPKTIRVQAGECLATIAKAHGFADWRTIYESPENASLRELRPDPHVLFPGDRVVIPERQTRAEAAEADQRHRFVRKASQPMLRLIMRDSHGDAVAGARYVLRIDGEELAGTTDDAGLIEQAVPPAARRAELDLWMQAEQQSADEIVDFGDTDSEGSQGAGDASAGDSAEAGERLVPLVLEIGHLDPVDEVSGVQARLFNLGFDPGPIDGITGPLTQEAIRHFQASRELEVDGIAGPVTQQELHDQHGC